MVMQQEPRDYTGILILLVVVALVMAPLLFISLRPSGEECQLLDPIERFFMRGC